MVLGQMPKRLCLTLKNPKAAMHSLMAIEITIQPDLALQACDTCHAIQHAHLPYNRHATCKMTTWHTTYNMARVKPRTEACSTTAASARPVS
jgi:hypothetical protein